MGMYKMTKITTILFLLMLVIPLASCSVPSRKLMPASRGSGTVYEGVYGRGSGYYCELRIPHWGPDTKIWAGTYAKASDAARACDVVIYYTELRRIVNGFRSMHYNFPDSHYFIDKICDSKTEVFFNDVLRQRDVTSVKALIMHQTKFFVATLEAVNNFIVDYVAHRPNDDIP